MVGILLVMLAVALALVVCLVGSAVYRASVVRAAGTPTVLRDLHGGAWRHGALVYRSQELRFYALRSVRFGADLTTQRRGMVLVDRREPHSSEADVAEPGDRILRLTGTDLRARGVDVEVCLDARGAAALLAWIEAYSKDTVRTSHPRRSSGGGRR